MKRLTHIFYDDRDVMMFHLVPCILSKHLHVERLKLKKREHENKFSLRFASSPTTYY